MQYRYKKVTIYQNYIEQNQQAINSACLVPPSWFANTHTQYNVVKSNVLTDFGQDQFSLLSIFPMMYLHENTKWRHQRTKPDGHHKTLSFLPKELKGEP
jgi:hypothetical protein